jgi:hypothetical protein
MRHNSFTDTRAVQACRRRHGRVVDHVIKDPKPTSIEPQTGM